MKHPNFTIATLLFVSAMLTGAGSVVHHSILLALFAGACFFAGIFAAFEGDNNNTDQQ